MRASAYPTNYSRYPLLRLFIFIIIIIIIIIIIAVVVVIVIIIIIKCRAGAQRIIAVIPYFGYKHHRRKASVSTKHRYYIII